MNRSAVQRRPRQTTCQQCGRTVVLVDCGVREHRQTRTRREQLDGRCPGRVYIHHGFGGEDCPEPDEDPVY